MALYVNIFASLLLKLVTVVRALTKTWDVTNERIFLVTLRNIQRIVNK